MKKLKSIYKRLIIIFAAAAAGICFGLLINKFFCIVIVSGNSMYPTLKNGCWLKCTTDTSDISVNDIVIVKTSGYPTLVKRIVGKPGDKLIIKAGELYRNEVKEELGLETMSNDNYGCLSESQIYVVPDNCYFVMGDNRQNSVDSREIGAIPKENITGVAERVIFGDTSFSKQ